MDQFEPQNLVESVLTLEFGRLNTISFVQAMNVLGSLALKSMPFQRKISITQQKWTWYCHDAIFMSFENCLYAFHGKVSDEPRSAMEYEFEDSKPYSAKTVEGKRDYKDASKEDWLMHLSGGVDLFSRNVSNARAKIWRVPSTRSAISSSSSSSSVTGRLIGT